MTLVGRLAEASQRIAKDHLRPLFARHGLQPGEFDVLATLRRADPPHALNPGALHQATMVTSGAMTGRIDRLERAGLVERRPDPKDRRALTVALTERGFELIDEVITHHVANEARILSGLDAHEQEQLAELLKKLLATLPDSRD